MSQNTPAAMSNQAFFDAVMSDDRGMQKQAAENVNEYTRVKMREDGFLRRILPPKPITADDLDIQVDTDKPVVIMEKEPGSPPAISVPFGTNPLGRYIKGSRYRVMFGRIMSEKFYKDVQELMTYRMDIRQVLSDNSIKDMLTEEDSKWIHATNAALGGAAGATVTTTGAIQWQEVVGGITRANVAESLKIMPSTSSRLENHCGLINNITIKDFLKWHRDEVGGDLAENFLLNGYAEQQLFGIKFIVTIKQDLVPTDTVFYYAEPKFLGIFMTLEDATMFMDRRAFMVEFFCYETIGAAIGNTAGCARADFVPTP